VAERYQRIEVAFILQTNFHAETRCTLAIEDHKLGQSFRMVDGIFVIGDGLFSFGNRGVLILEHIVPQPAVDAGFLRLEDVVAQTKVSVQKSLVILVGGVQVLQQSQQPGAVEFGEFPFDVAPAG
jgi:hypothetical protein